MQTVRHEEAESQLRISLATLRKTAEDCPELSQIRLAICAGLDRLSLLYQNTNRTAEADKSLNLAVALAEKLAAEKPNNPDVRRQQTHLQIHRVERIAATGQFSQAQDLPKCLTSLAKLADDYSAAPDFRRDLAQALDLLGCLLTKESKKAEAAKTFREVRRLREELTRNYPEAPGHFRELAWFLATCPDESIRDAKLAEQLAQRTVALAPEDGDGWSTLGVARYRIGDWQKAQSALLQATRLQNGGGFAQWLFLAMAYHQLSDHAQAGQWVDKANVWIEQNQPVSEDLARLRSEAEKVMGRPSAHLQGGPESP
jgi:tetratricopeptide (TPR) repeat protein